MRRQSLDAVLPAVAVAVAGASSAESGVQVTQGTWTGRTAGAGGQINPESPSEGPTGRTITHTREVGQSARREVRTGVAPDAHLRCNHPLVYLNGCRIY
jgi:hypothetical protein